MPGLGDDPAARPAGRGHMRASHADREQVLDTLKDAFVQGRLTKGEFDLRVGDVLASRTYADLAALTADLPAGPPAGQRPRQRIPAYARQPPAKVFRNGARVIAAATVLTVGVWAGAVLSNTDNQLVGALVASVTLLWFGIVLMVGAIMLESRLQQRYGRQLPPASGQGGGQAAERALPADPAGPLRPGDHGGRHTAEASRRPVSRPSLLAGPGLSPS